MDIKSIPSKITKLFHKFKYAIIVLVVGLVLLLLPSKTTTESTEEAQGTMDTNAHSYAISAEELAAILQSVQGAGRVQVLLSVASGEKIIYQADSDINKSGDSENKRVDTIIITDSHRNENGLISYIDPPTYQGAIVVCDGADSASVRLAIIQAVSKITGLGADNICVLKMK